MTAKRTDGSAEQYQQIGRLIEGLEDSKSDRKQMRVDFKDGVDRLTTALSTLAGDVRQLSQIALSTASQVTELVRQDLGNRMVLVESSVKAFETRLGRYEQEDCSKRLTDLESDARFHKAIIGAGVGFVGRVLALIAASGVLGALFAKALHITH
jgi:hypothetical protein